MVNLQSIEVQDFFALDHLEITDVPNILLLTGGNAAGKTSLTRAIEALVTGSVVNEDGTRIDQDRLKHDGMPAEIIGTFVDADGDAFSVRRRYASSHSLSLIRGEDELDLKVSEWDVHCETLFGAKPEMLRAVLRSDRFLAMPSREQVALVCTIMDLDVQKGHLIGALPEDAQDMAANLLSTVTSEGAELLDRAADIAVSNRRKLKAVVEEADAELEVAKKNLAEVEGRWADGFAALMSEDELARQEEIIQQAREKKRNVNVRTTETREAIQRLDAKITAAAAEFADLRSAAEKADAAREEWEQDKTRLQSRVSSANAQIEQWSGSADEVRQEEERYRRKLEAARSRERMLGNLFAAVSEGVDEETAACPLCGGEVDPDRLRERGSRRIAANERAIEGLESLLTEAVEHRKMYDDKVTAARAALAGARKELAELGEKPAMPDAYRKQMGPARERRHELEEERKELIHQQAAFAREVNSLMPDDELVLLEEKVERHNHQHQLLSSARLKLTEAETKHERAVERRDKALVIAEEWTPAGLATRLVVERMGPTLDLLNSLVASQGWEITIGPEMQIIVNTPDRTETPEEMSRGEQIYLAAAFQATFAKICGFGVVTVDDASALDHEHTKMLVEAATEFAPDLTWIIARHHGVEHEAATEFVIE